MDNPSQSLKIEVVPDPRPNIRIIKLSGLLNIHNSSELLDAAKQEPVPEVLLVDLQGISYIDSAALGSFVSLHVMADENGRKYALIGANDRLKSLFDMTQVRAFLSIYDSQAEAEARLL